MKKALFILALVQGVSLFGAAAPSENIGRIEVLIRQISGNLSNPFSKLGGESFSTVPYGFDKEMLCEKIVRTLTPLANKRDMPVLKLYLKALTLLPSTTPDVQHLLNDALKGVSALG